MSESKKLDITSTAIEKGIDVIKDFLQKLAGPAAEELGLLMSDNIKLWRFKNQLSILEKARTYVSVKNIDVKGISPKILVPLLEGASLEEDKDLQDMWAALLVNYIDSSKNYESNVFPYVLSQLSTVEVKLIDRFYLARLIPEPEIAGTGAEISNLVRLGVIRILVYNGISLSGHVLYEITELGRQFIEACKLPE